MKRLAPFCAVGVFAVVVAAGSSPAAAKADERLDGDYAFVLTRTCAQGSPGQPGMGDNLVLLSNVTNRVTAVRGAIHFDGHGGGTFETDELQLNMNVVSAGTQQTGSAVSTCRLEYQVDDTGRVQLRLRDCLAAGTANLAGLTFTPTPLDFDAQLSADGKTLLLSDIDPAVESVTVHGGAFDNLVFTRVCPRSGTAVRVR